MGSLVILNWVAASSGLHAQQTTLTSPVLTPVPRLVGFSGVFLPADHLPVAPVETVTIAIYRDREGGDALWHETQHVAMDADGRYSLLMGSTFADGLPLEVFTRGEPRWIGITVQRSGETEQPRVHLASVPYALKAADADTLGGLPASAYLLAAPRSSSSSSTASSSPQASGQSPQGISALTAGTPGYLGVFVDSANLGDSALFQTAGSIGLGTTTPRDRFHVAVNNGSGALTGYAVQNLSGSAGAYSGMLFYDQNGTLGLFQGFNNATHEYRINNVGSGGSINFRIAGNSKLLVANSGNIGIRTMHPMATLDLQAGADGTGANDPKAIAFQWNGGGYRHWIRTRHNSLLGSDNAIDFFVNNHSSMDGSSGPGVGSSHVMTLDSGNVGIGTTDPAFKLAVVDASNTGLRVQTNVAGGTVASFGGFGDFNIDAAGVHGGRLIAKENGNVGIGTGAPVARLHVGTAHDSNPGFISAWDSRHVVIGGPASNGGIGMSYDQTNNVGYIEALTPNVAFRNLVLQYGGGNVGIGTGTTSPTEKLSVAGTVQSTTGGFKFPDGSVQTTAMGTMYTALRTDQVWIPDAQQLPVLSLNSLPTGTYLLTATLSFHNNANYSFSDNTRHIYCQFPEGIPYKLSIAGFGHETMTFHTIMPISSGSVDVVCGRLFSNQDQVLTWERRLTAMKIGDVISQ